MNVISECDTASSATWAGANLVEPLSLELSRKIASATNLKTAKYLAVLSEQKNSQKRIDFALGGQTDFDPSPDDVLAAYLREFPQPSFVVFEDWMSRPGDRFLREKRMPFHVSGNGVYQVFHTHEAGLHAAWHRGCANYSPLFHGFVFLGSMPTVFSPETLIASAKLAALLFGIFDGESYLIARLPEQ